MPFYTYRAYDMKGKGYKSIIEAHSINEAKNKLLDLGIHLAAIYEKKVTKIVHLKKESVLHFTTQIAQLLEAGFPLYESINLLKEQTSKEDLTSILSGLSESLKSGLSFKEALLKFPKCFDSLYLAMVEIGEASGRLAQTLYFIAAEYEKQNKLHKQISSALLYPSILIGFCFLLLILLFYYIIPSLEVLFQDRAVHHFTRFVIAVSHHVKKFVLLYLASFFLGGFYMRYSFKKGLYKDFLDRLFLRIPYLKTLIRDLCLTRFSSVMYLLLQGGVPMLNALTLSNHLISNNAIKNIFQSAQKKVEEGERLSGELKKYTFFPVLFIRMIFVGENSGEIVTCFKNLSHIYEQESQKKLSKVMTLLSPIILLGMGVIIGFIMLAILIPLTDINSISI